MTCRLDMLCMGYAGTDASNAKSWPPLSSEYEFVFNFMSSPSFSICPLHFSTFDIVTGKKLSEPKMSPPMDMAVLPKPLQEAFAQAAQIMAFVKTYDMETYQVEKDGEDIKLKTNS
jgi:nitrite reductase/ring-hydroxylating ferredoxin subunit